MTMIETSASYDPETGRTGRPEGLLPRLLRRLDAHATLLLVLPGVVLLLAVIGYPVAYNIVNSFTNRNLSFPVTDWVGLANYAAVLSDPAFWSAIVKTLVWTAGSVAGQLLVGFAGAVALQNIRWGQAPLRLALIVPWAFPSIVLAFSWRFLLDPLYSVLNDVLMRVGVISEPVAWLGQSSTAMPSLIAMNVWFGFPFMMVALLAGLATIPVERYESARVDGATYWQELRFVTLPALRRLIGALVVLRTIWVFNNFDFVYLTTGGGPVTSTQTLPVYAFQVGWASYDIGRMAAVCVAMLALLVLIIGGYLRLVRIEGDD
jgi:multiple sugar transport system permease protein